MKRTDEEIAVRWQRRYAGRRFILGVPVQRERLGTLIDSYVVLNIAERHVWHALRRPAYRVLREAARVMERVVG